MKIFETSTNYEGTADELAKFEVAKKNAEYTVDLKLDISDIEEKITNEVANGISEAINISIGTTEKKS